MSTPYLGQITTFGFGFAPKGWALCNGQLLSISQNAALFALLGTAFGGNGTSTFALPNLQASFALCNSSAYPIGSTGGEANHTLTTSELPTHNHPVLASTGTPDSDLPAANYPSSLNSSAFSSTANTTLSPGSSAVGGGQSHPNMPPYLGVNFCIALQGIFPSRS
jgi:microcystin-dependent protein